MKPFALLLSLMAVTLLTACERLPQSPRGHAVGEVWLSDAEPIPKSYGRLVAITEAKADGGIAHFWFEDDKLTIRIVEVNYGARYIYKDVLVVERDLLK